MNGWEIILYPKASTGSWLLFNVPVATNSTYVQYMINTVTGAAAKFSGMDSRTWGLFSDDLYFGDSTKVMKADDGLNDNEEMNSLTDPTKSDTDGDGLTDMEERDYQKDVEIAQGIREPEHIIEVEADEDCGRQPIRRDRLRQTVGG